MNDSTQPMLTVEQLDRTIEKMEKGLAHARNLRDFIAQTGPQTLTNASQGVQLTARRDMLGTLKQVVPKELQKKGARWTKPAIRQFIIKGGKGDLLMRNGTVDKSDPLGSFMARNSDPEKMQHPLLKKVKEQRGTTPGEYVLTRNLEETPG